MDERDFGRFLEIAGDLWSSVEAYHDAAAIFSFLTVKERRTSVEMVNQIMFFAFWGGTGGGLRRV